MPSDAEHGRELFMQRCINCIDVLIIKNDNAKNRRWDWSRLLAHILPGMGKARLRRGHGGSGPIPEQGPPLRDERREGARCAGRERQARLGAGASPPGHEAGPSLSAPRASAVPSAVWVQSLCHGFRPGRHAAPAGTGTWSSCHHSQGLPLIPLLGELWNPCWKLPHSAAPLPCGLERGPEAYFRSEDPEGWCLGTARGTMRVRFVRCRPRLPGALPARVTRV